MHTNKENYQRITKELEPYRATLVAVSKIKPVPAIEELYAMGHRDFGENYVQELVDKQGRLPADIRWHYIGHLQSNKVKYITPFVHLIHGIDSLKLLKEVNKQGQKQDRTINVLLQVHIAREETKHGFSETDLLAPDFALGLQGLDHICIKGLMGMASFSDDAELVRSEFRKLKELFQKLAAIKRPNLQVEVLSMGMSGDYRLALQEGATMVRIGSSIFGRR